jgi:hypothetical protein
MFWTLTDRSRGVVHSTGARPERMMWNGHALLIIYVMDDGDK